MATISTSIINKRDTTSIKKRNEIKSIWARYIAYAASRKNERVLWFLKSIMIIPCVVMIPAIYLMAMATPNYIWFIGLTIILFYTNVVAHIADLKNTVYIPLYHITIAIMVLIPIIAYLIA